MRNNEKISIIIPFKNSGKYISKCIDSILNQTYTNYEVLLVNSNSTDNTRDIINDYDSKKIKLLESIEPGVSAARNIAIKNSSGKYIVFVDSDDYVEPTYLESLINQMNDNVVITMCNFIKVDENGNTIEKYNVKDSAYTVTEFIDNLFGLRETQYNGYLWNKLFLSDIIKMNDIRFSNDVVLNEDRLFITNYLVNLPTDNLILYKNKELYNYVQHNESVIQKLHNNKLNEKDIITEIKAFERCEKLLSQFKTSRENIVDESTERVIQIIKKMPYKTEEYNYLKKYLKHIRKKYHYYLDCRRRMQLFVYEKYCLRRWIAKVYSGND